MELVRSNCGALVERISRDREQMCMSMKEMEEVGFGIAWEGVEWHETLYSTV